MSDPISIKLTEQAQTILREMQTLPERMATEIAAAMDKENQFTIGHIQSEHLTGQGPFPVEQHKLGVRTNRLRSSLRASDAEVVSDRIISGIGTNVVYAAIHEFGGRIHHGARSGSVRLRTNAQGNLLHQPGSRQLAVFAKSSHKRAKEVKFSAQAYDVDMPARAPITTGIEERAENYGAAVSAAVEKAWEGNK